VSLEEARKKWEEIEGEDAEIRKRMADWEFINSQKLRMACKLARMNIVDFRDLLRKANIPVIT